MKRMFVLALLNFLLAFAAHAEGGLSLRPTASQATGYGVTAYDVKTRNWAYAIRFPDPASATTVVSKLCGPNCLIGGPFEKCGLIASNGANAGFGEGPDVASAEKAALAKCGSGNCEAAIWGCNSMSAGESAGYRLEAHHAKNFGAIAFDEQSGALGSAYDYGSFGEAVAAAKTNCGKSCRIYLAQAGSCAALARGGSSIATGEGIDGAAAERMALAKCGNAACRTLTWYCNSAQR